MDKSNKALQDEVIFHKQTLGKLQTAKEEAERTSNAKSEFMARMSHELRTPLNAILGFSQLLSSNPLDMTSQQIEDIKIIEKAGGHLLNLVNDVLDLSSIEQGKMEIIKEDVSVRQMLEDVYLLIKPLAEKQNINIILPLTKNNDYKVFVDPQRFKQVLINLISNAVKYNRENGTVTIRCQKTPNNNIQIDIKDTGRGISLENQKQIFEPFNRGNSSKTQIEGTGIGLTITKYLVELMGGTITLKSQLDKGSYFSIKLPESKVSVPPISEAQNKPETVSSGIGSNQPFSILYIEDNTFSRKLIEEILLSRPDIRHLSSPNMKLGIKSAQQYHPDLILMDMNLPDIDGMEGIKILQSDPKTKNIPVIALSANALPNHIKEALEIGFKDYITKPLNIISFLELIDRHLSQK
ncbi:MAG: response regulator [Nitrospinae bacterium]|nr:response regulator [Nitrospinota bacterium]